MIRVWFPEYGELEEEGTDYPGGLREACEAACRAFDDHAGGFTEQGFKVKALDRGKVWTVTVETELAREYHARPLFGGVLRECVDSWALETVAEIQRSDADAISLPVPPPGPPLRVEATLAENGDAWSWTLTPDQVERRGNAVGGFRVTDRLRAWSGQKKAGVLEDAGGHDDIEALRASASRTDPGDQETPPPRETSAHGGSLETVCETLNDDPR